MKKSTVILLIVLIVAAFIYFYTKGDEVPDSGSLLGIGSAAVSANVGAEVLALLNQIKSLEIDPAIFSAPVYRSLQDYSVAIPDQNVGRPNPFEPIR